VLPLGVRTLAIKFHKIRDMPTRGICNRIEDTQIQFLIDLVADGTKAHVPKPNFDTLPYSSGGFVQMIGGGGCGVCGAAYLTPVVVLLSAPMGASSGTKLARPGMADVSGIVEMGTGSGV
jgi:hypothetical protein